jgi:arsenite-transporting ATPase
MLLFAGKGGVGKTSVAAATGVVTARSGRRTVVMSLDPAHSLSDAFDLDRSLMDTQSGQIVPVAENLWIQELDVHQEISKHWGEVHKYISLLLNTSGIDEILAEELAILPGMEEIAALLYVNQYVREKSFDVILLDCAPTAESIRFISLPKTLEWYMRKVFRLERQLMRAMRPLARKWAEIPLPEDDYFVAIERLFEKL